MNPDDQARRLRARTRAGRVVIRKGQLGDPEVDFTPTVGADAISLLTRLSLESFSLAGHEQGAYSRKDIPVCFVPRTRR